MTELEAWEYLAKCWGEANSELAAIPTRDGKAFSSLGLCSSIEGLCACWMINIETYKSMQLRIPNSGGTYLWPLNADGAICRRNFCLEQVEKLKGGEP